MHKKQPCFHQNHTAHTWLNWGGGGGSYILFNQNPSSLNNYTDIPTALWFVIPTALFCTETTIQLSFLNSIIIFNFTGKEDMPSSRDPMAFIMFLIHRGSSPKLEAKPVPLIIKKIFFVV